MGRPSVLLLEDETLIALGIEATLTSNGFDVMEPCQSVREAEDLLRDRVPDVAILDINLGRERTSFSMAETLQERGIPFMFLTGYTNSTVQFPVSLEAVSRLSKPVMEAQLLEALEGLLKQRNTVR